MSAVAWVCYGVLVSVLLSAAALVAEAALRSWHRGARWSWLGALLAGVALPVWAYLRPSEPLAPDALLAPVLELAPMVIASPVEPAVGWPHWPAAAWAIASALAVLVLLLSHRALARARRSWREADVDGTRVLVSRDLGPAVVGVVRPRIVVPEWLLALDAALRRLMLLHEEEHRAAGDSRMLLGGLLLCAAMPWNPLLWWQLHRMRVAMELDCDERVLARAGDPARYGQLLLEVGRRRSERYLLAAAFAEPRVLLEKRVRALLQWPRAPRPLRAVLLGGAALLLLGFAYATPDPLARAQQPVPSAEQLVQAVIERVTGEEEATTSPASVPVVPQDTVRPPRLLNEAVLRAKAQEVYPPLLRDAGIGGTAQVYVHVDTLGRVARMQIDKSSGYPALDEAALKVAAVAQFRPAEEDGRKVTAWVTLPVQFTVGTQRPPIERASAATDSARARATVSTRPGEGYQTRALRNGSEVAQAMVRNYPPLLRDAGIGGTAVIGVFANEEGLATKTQVMTSSGYRALDEAALKVVELMRFEPAAEAGWVQVPVQFTPPGNLEAGPQLTPMTLRPELKNAPAVQRALIENYPAALRDAGIGGSPVVWFLIGEDGMVRKVQLSKSSGFVALDEAALRVAQVMEFTPAFNRDRKVAVWVEIPIVFTSR